MISAARKNAQISSLRGRTDRQNRQGTQQKLKDTTGQATRGIQKAWSGNCIGTVDSNLEKNLYFQFMHGHRLNPGGEMFVDVGRQSDGRRTVRLLVMIKC